ASYSEGAGVDPERCASETPGRHRLIVARFLWRQMAYRRSLLRPAVPFEFVEAWRPSHIYRHKSAGRHLAEGGTVATNGTAGAVESKSFSESALSCASPIGPDDAISARPSTMRIFSLVECRMLTSISRLEK